MQREVDDARFTSVDSSVRELRKHMDCELSGAFRRLSFQQAWMAQRFSYHQQLEHDMAVFAKNMKTRLGKIEQEVAAGGDCATSGSVEADERSEDDDDAKRLNILED